MSARSLTKLPHLVIFNGLDYSADNGAKTATGTRSATSRLFSLQFFEAQLFAPALLTNGLHRLPNVAFATLLCQLNLAFPLRKAIDLYTGVAVEAKGTTDAFLIMFTALILFADRHTTGVTLIVAALRKTMVYRDAIVEYKTFTLPESFFPGDLLEVFENASLQ